ncbi:MAG TPA: class I SAM-dependent methyltransferase [Kiloniellales bacterium]
MFSSEQAAEVAKYGEAYKSPRYAMGEARKAQAQRDLSALPWRGSYLDVGCGRGEMLDYAGAIGFREVIGVEVVPALLQRRNVICAAAWDLPFFAGAFEIVSLFDVIEHLLPGDDEKVCRELDRVAAHAILITANNRESRSHIGQELHVNRRPYEEWDALFKTWFTGEVAWLAKGQNISETWRVTK